MYFTETEVAMSDIMKALPENQEPGGNLPGEFIQEEAQLLQEFEMI